MRSSGEHVALRGIFNNRVWIAHAVTVIKDTTHETALLEMPGSQNAIPESSWHRLYGDHVRRNRWSEAKSNNWQLRNATWQTNRLVMLLEPEKYYSIMFFWNEETGSFLNYYINFQLPYRRTSCGFDTLDLELDIVVEPTFAWHWKDEADYQEGIREGCIEKLWVETIERESHEVIERIEKRRYPFDGSWLDWRPDAAWTPPVLREEWKEI